MSGAEGSAQPATTAAQRKQLQGEGNASESLVGIHESYHNVYRMMRCGMVSRRLSRGRNRPLLVNGRFCRIVRGVQRLLCE